MGRARARWKTIIVDRDGESLTAYLHPPGTLRNPNNWAWTCKKAGIHGRSLKVELFAEAKVRAQAWFKGEPGREERERQERSILTWDDWDAIQAAQAASRPEKDRLRAERTLEECRKARRLFVAVTGAEHASAVDVDMVGRFQIECPKRLSKFKRPYGKTTVNKTLSHMSASFNRCNRNAGKKCVRGVVPSQRLLDGNPFEQVQWVEPDAKPIRQFQRSELKSLFGWKFIGGCPLLATFAKVSLWACGRLEEMTELRWDWLDADGYISIPDANAKWGKGKTFRIPPALVADLQGCRTGNSFVWAGYVEQIRAYHKDAGHGAAALKVKAFAPQRLRVSFQKWIAAWAKEAEAGKGLSHHAFRRTGLQWSREGQLQGGRGRLCQGGQCRAGRGRQALHDQARAALG